MSKTLLKMNCVCLCCLCVGAQLIIQSFIFTLVQTFIIITLNKNGYIHKKDAHQQQEWLGQWIYFYLGLKQDYHVL